MADTWVMLPSHYRDATMMLLVGSWAFVRYDVVDEIVLSLFCSLSIRVTGGSVVIDFKKK